MKCLILMFCFVLCPALNLKAEDISRFETLQTLIQRIESEKVINKSKAEIIDIFLNDLASAFDLGFKVSYSDTSLEIEKNDTVNIFDCTNETEVAGIMIFLADYSAKIDSTLKYYQIDFELEYYLCDFLLSSVDNNGNSRIITSENLGKTVDKEYDFEYIKNERKEYEISSIKTNQCSGKSVSLRIGDIIESINSVPARYFTNNLVQSLIFENDSIDLTLSSRSVIRMERCKSKPLQKNVPFSVTEISKKAVYLKINSFYGKKMSQEIFKEIIKKRYKRIIIDIRNNHGGQVKEMVDFLSLFLKNNEPIVRISSPNKIHEHIFLSNMNKPVKIPEIFILINHSTASGANIIAGVLRDKHNAVIIGENSYGVNAIHRSAYLSPEPYIANFLVGTFSLYGSHDTLENGIKPDHYIMDCYTNGDDILNYAVQAEYIK